MSNNNSMAKIFDKVKFFDKVKILSGGISNAPTYSLQRSVSPVEGGGSEITFTVNTTNVADGTSLPYTISGISQSDVTSGSLTGSFSVASNTASTTLGVSLEPTSPGVGSASLALNNGAASISVFPAPTYSLTRSSASVDEGSSITFTLTTTGVANGTSVPYTISGISEGDLSSGSLSGNFVVNNGSATVTVALASDVLVEGTETISITAQGASTSASVNDLTPTYTLSRSAASINEGSSVTFTLTTTNVANGTSIPYSISGISAGDLSSGSLTGNFVINNGSATVTLTAANDALTEGTETITITAASQTSSATIIDTSLTSYSNETVLFLRGDNFVDSSIHNQTISVFGNTSISTSVKKYGTGSMYFDGNGDYLTAPNNSNLFKLNADDFTVEAWVYSNFSSGSTYRGIWTNRTFTHLGALWVGFQGTSFGAFYDSTAFRTDFGVVNDNTWHHVALTRLAGTMSIWINGINLRSGNPNVSFPNGLSCKVGDSWIGYIDNLRVIKGAAIYTSNFTPSEVPA